MRNSIRFKIKDICVSKDFMLTMQEIRFTHNFRYTILKKGDIEITIQEKRIKNKINTAVYIENNQKSVYTNYSVKKEDILTLNNLIK